jgi:CheY-like chemotaxis protein
MTIRIVFVDDEVNILEGMRRAFHSMRGEWSMDFLPSGAAALESLAIAPADVIVSDMRMPGMDGWQLLAEVKKLYPHTVRLVLSGQADSTSVMRAVGTAQRYLAKPCASEAVKAAIAQTLTLRQLLSSDRLAQLVGAVGMLPSAPTVFQNILTWVFTQDMQLQWGTTMQDLPGLAFTSNHARIAMFSDTLRYGDANLHLVYQQSDSSQNTPGRMRLTGVGFSYEPGPWFVSGDSNYTQNSYFGDLLSWYLSAGMRFGRFAPYTLYSTTHQESIGTSTLTSLGDQHTVAAGVRWDFAKNLDFKLQLERITLDSLDDPAAFANLQPGARAGDRAHVISLALDFLF